MNSMAISVAKIELESTVTHAQIDV